MSLALSAGTCLFLDINRPCLNFNDSSKCKMNLEMWHFLFPTEQRLNRLPIVYSAENTFQIKLGASSIFYSVFFCIFLHNSISAFCSLLPFLIVCFLCMSGTFLISRLTDWENNKEELKKTKKKKNQEREKEKEPIVVEGIPKNGVKRHC